VVERDNLFRWCLGVAGNVLELPRASDEPVVDAVGSVPASSAIRRPSATLVPDTEAERVAVFDHSAEGMALVSNADATRAYVVDIDAGACACPDWIALDSLDSHLTQESGLVETLM
jgi:hypothetical protein